MRNYEDIIKDIEWTKQQIKQMQEGLKKLSKELSDSAKEKANRAVGRYYLHKNAESGCYTFSYCQDVSTREDIKISEYTTEITQTLVTYRGYCTCRCVSQKYFNNLIILSPEQSAEIQNTIDKVMHREMPVFLLYAYLNGVFNS